MNIDMKNGYDSSDQDLRPDDALCTAAQQGDGQAAETLVKRYSRLVKTCARPFFLMGADEEDLLQEGMLGLLKAVREFDAGNGTPFEAFARLCVTRRIYSAVRAAAAFKHDPLNRSMSIDRPLFEDLAESHTRVAAPICDPESLVIGNEERAELVRRLYSVLSEFEAKVLTLFLDGLSYEQMAETLHKPIKSVDNAIQRIKRKSATVKPQ
ncbi:sigma-70 family RNA polymerase sigma factor [Butyricicoccus sp. Marseille-Q5471]|uniref:sigma-70 family RNA polymerase sigma factor n=1 Tax=Butyricicoccus sp. Marseille-Q5471 TaxID=3039493 RepID=UPI0024BC9078|nr:sigma-70 family RNA polymerase sigma factor [Butyricicoccus sp. Marseille-Q5471]